MSKKSSKQKTCKKCGGNLHGPKCLLCELFEAGLAYDGVEKERLNNPKLSDALKVHPRQIPAAMARDKRHGVPTDYHPDGRPIITSRAHQKRLIKSLGYFNQDGGYGD